MRRFRLFFLIAALSTCLGSSDCSESSSSARGANPSGSVGDGGPASAMPEPGGALLFGLGALIAAAAVRRTRNQG